MLLKYVVPKLGATLRDDFRINPRKQDMIPLERVLAWSTLLRPSIFSPLLETEFFPKWLDVLHIWLTQPRPSYEEISQWYSFWKNTFPEQVQEMPGVSAGFTRGLQLMNTAIELGPDAPTKLPRPERLPPSASVGAAAVAKAQQAAPARPVIHAQEITFRSIVEEHAAQHNLLFIPAGRVHETSRQPLFKVSQRADGRGGLLVYIDDDAVWAQDGDVWRAITLDNMVLRAMKG
jgi:tuftelin-interacting protein 11